MVLRAYALYLTVVMGLHVLLWLLIPWYRYGVALLWAPEFLWNWAIAFLDLHHLEQVERAAGFVSFV